MFEAYHGPKTLVAIPVDHYHERPPGFYEQGMAFILEHHRDKREERKGQSLHWR
jgi:hypothetical protein